METEDQPRKAPEPALLAFPDAPTIVIAGQRWPVPLLSPRQNRVIEPLIVPLFAQLYPKMKEFQEALKEFKAGDAPPIDAVVRLKSVSLSTEQYDELITIVGAALSRAHVEFRRQIDPVDPRKWVPDSTPLLDMTGVTSVELIGAATVIMKQTGMPMLAEKLAAKVKAPPSGEASAPSTGTD